MTKKQWPLSAKFAEWAGALLQIETLADAASYVDAVGWEQKKLLRKLIRAAQDLRADFVRQMEKDK